MKGDLNYIEFHCNNKKHSIGYKYLETAKKWIYYINEGKKYIKKGGENKTEILTIEDVEVVDKN